MKTLTTLICIILIGFASNYSDNPTDKQKANTQSIVTDLDSSHCPNCRDTGCIYFQINNEVIQAGGDGTDGEIREAAERIFILRGITDSGTIKNVLAEYYL